MQLPSKLGITESELEKNLKLYFQAAAKEYIGMFLGQHSLQYTINFREQRLYWLMREVFTNTIPDELLVARLFQISVTQSRTLIRMVISRYQYEFQDKINDILKRTVEDCTPTGTGGYYEVTIRSSYIVESLNNIIITEDGTLERIMRKPRTASVYRLYPDSYFKLCEKFKLPKKLPK